MRINVLPNGRLVLPAPLRRRLGIERGGQLIAELEGDTVRLTTPDQALDEARALFRRYVPEGAKIVDEVIEDRRKEVAEDADGGRSRDEPG